MAITVKVAKAHEGQLADEDILQELESVRKAVREVVIPYREGSINFVFIKGIYVPAERKMITACLFVNKMDKAIIELHGELRLGLNIENTMVAKTTVDFDETFMGALAKDEALLVHFNIPVKGLTESREFSIEDVYGKFENVRVTFA